jgi:hypothetical protein
LLYILLFVFIVGINLLIKNKGAIEKIFEVPSENEEKYTENIRKEVKSDSIISQPLSETKTMAQNKNFEIQKQQNSVKNPSIFLKGKTLKEAIILKEILDLPVGLR